MTRRSPRPNCCMPISTCLPGPWRKAAHRTMYLTLGPGHRPGAGGATARSRQLRSSASGARDVGDRSSGACASQPREQGDASSGPASARGSSSSAPQTDTTKIV
jgi:hypothetical protein